MSSRVYAVYGYEPAVLATAMAYFSRSPNPLDVSLSEVSADRAGRFFEEYYGKYGHASIADMAHLPVAFEGVTQLEAFELWDEPLVDGQEQSTRYQEFGGNDCYAVPPEVEVGGEAAKTLYHQIAQSLLANYQRSLGQAETLLRESHPQPPDMSERQYGRTIKARAFDVARYWLFNGVKTSMGQLMSARTLEKQVARLMASPYQTVRNLAERLRCAVMEEEPLCAPGVTCDHPLGLGLAKYFQPDEMLLQRASLAAELARKLVANIKQSRGVANEGYDGLSAVYYPLAKLVKKYSLVRLHAALLLYPHTNLRLVTLVGALGETNAQAIVGQLLSLRGPHTPFPKELSADRSHLFEVTMDIGGMRDLHRHRNVVQLHQPLSEQNSFVVPELVTAKLDPEQWQSQWQQCQAQVTQLRQMVGLGADFALPFGNLRRTLFAMDTTQLVYMTELRTKPAGHPSYRQIAAQMWSQFCQENPHLAEYGRVHPFKSDLEIDIFQR